MDKLFVKSKNIKLKHDVELHYMHNQMVLVVIHKCDDIQILYMAFHRVEHP